MIRPPLCGRKPTLVEKNEDAARGLLQRFKGLSIRLPPPPACSKKPAYISLDSLPCEQMSLRRVHSACLTRTAVLENSASNLGMRNRSVPPVVDHGGGASVLPCAAPGRSA